MTTWRTPAALTVPVAANGTPTSAFCAIWTSCSESFGTTTAAAWAAGLTSPGTGPDGIHVGSPSLPSQQATALLTFLELVTALLIVKPSKVSDEWSSPRNLIRLAGVEPLAWLG